MIASHVIETTLAILKPDLVARARDLQVSDFVSSYARRCRPLLACFFDYLVALGERRQVIKKQARKTRTHPHMLYSIW